MEFLLICLVLLIELIKELLIILIEMSEYFFRPENERCSVIHPIIIMEKLNLLILYLHNFQQLLSSFVPLIVFMNVNLLLIFFIKMLLKIFCKRLYLFFDVGNCFKFDLMDEVEHMNEWGGYLIE